MLGLFFIEPVNWRKAVTLGTATGFATMTGATSSGKVRDVLICSLGCPASFAYDEDKIREMSKMENVFSQQLVKLRRQQNLSQEQIAHELFVSRQSVSKWEQGETVPDLDTVVKLANLLRVDLNELVGGQSPKEREQTQQSKTTLPEGQRPMNGWEFLSKNWWMIFPLLGALGWVISMFRY